MPRYVLSLDASKVKRTRLCVLGYKMRLPCFRGKGQTQSVAAFRHHKSVDKTDVIACILRTATCRTGQNTVPH